MKANIPFIPNDILANIFKRLQVRSLIRFQLVSKDWKNLIKHLIKTPSFVQDHLQYSSYRNPSLLLEQYHQRFLGVRLSVLDCDMQVGKVQQLPSTHLSSNFEVVGSSNGLVCLRTVEDGIHTCPLLVIWNPATREVRDVRPKTIVYSELFDENLRSNFRTHIEPDLIDYLGFGFSPLDNDYKIVRIHVFHPYDIIAVQVYSLNYGSWKEVDFGENLRGIAMSTTTVTINGIMFWITSWMDDEDMILLVDLSKEVCTVIDMPTIYAKYLRCLGFTEYENKFAAVAFDEDRSYSIHLWVMEKKYKCASRDSERWKWTKIYTSNPCSNQRALPVTIWRNEIVLLLDDGIENDGQTTILFLLNLTTSEFKRLDVRAYSYNFGQIMKRRPFPREDRDMEIDIFNYVESFVSIGRRINIGDF